MHICPVDCQWCADPRCASEGCVRSGERVDAALSACAQCGDVLVLTARIRVCVDCLRADDTAQLPNNGG
ncbi:MAG: hypothetical protein ABI190_01290 [Casimicrobiaceae bacterium]